MELINGQYYYWVWRNHTHYLFQHNGTNQSTTCLEIYPDGRKTTYYKTGCGYAIGRDEKDMREATSFEIVWLKKCDEEEELIPKEEFENMNQNNQPNIFN